MDSESENISMRSGMIYLTDLTQDELPNVEEESTKTSVATKESDSKGFVPPETASEVKLQQGANRKLHLMHTVQPANDNESMKRARVIVDQLHTVLFSSSDDTESSQDSTSSDGQSPYGDMDADEILRREYDLDALDGDGELEPIESDSILRQTEFLNNFRLPSISEVTSEITGLHVEDTDGMPKEKSEGEAVEGVEEVKAADQVDASDKDADYSPESSSVSVPSSQDSNQDKWLGISVDSSDDDLLELDDDSRLFNIKDVYKGSQTLEDAFIKFKSGYSQHQILQDEIAEIDPIKAKDHHDIIQVTIEFIYGLFDSVVNKIENRYKMCELENNLDKNLLLRHMITMRNKLSYEYDICRYLNTKMFEYFKRQKSIRSFTWLDPEAQAKEFKRYRAALNQLDHWLKVAAATKKRNALLISSVYMDLTYVRNMVLHTEEHLENTIRKSLAANKSESMQHFVERELRLMSQMRNEISDTRLFLITRKHTLAVYIEKTRKLERISDELCMDDFIYINNQVVALDKKIEERNNELKRMRNNYHCDLHEIQHNREKALSLQARLRDWQDIYSQKLNIRDTLRHKLFDAKITHSRIRKHHADLSYHGGLLAMPGLMHDYDETVARVEEKQAKIKLLKEAFKQESQRLVELESRCI